MTYSHTFMASIPTNMPLPANGNDSLFADLNVCHIIQIITVQDYDGPIRHENNQYLVVYVDYKHMEQQDPELCLTISENYYFLYSTLNDATLQYLRERLPVDVGVLFVVINIQYHKLITPATAYFTIINYNNVKALRDIRGSDVGVLVSLTGTVTRTTDVKPELVMGTFECDVCGQVVKEINQQFQFTKPNRCSSNSCPNRTKFTFRMKESQFADWQRIKMQENTNEIPAGSMPRSMDLILRNHLVEKVKPGDKIQAVGNLIVIPDVSQMTRQGQSAEITRGKEGEEGVTGYGNLGVRTMV